MANGSLLIDNDGVVATFTLNRPDKLNALNESLLGELASAFGELADKTPRVVVVTGAGKAFSAGVDIGEMSGMSTVEAKRRADAGHELGARIESLPCPVIAAGNGVALGGGGGGARPGDFFSAPQTPRSGPPPGDT